MGLFRVCLRTVSIIAAVAICPLIAYGNSENSNRGRLTVVFHEGGQLYGAVAIGVGAKEPPEARITLVGPDGATRVLVAVAGRFLEVELPTGGVLLVRTEDPGWWAPEVELSVDNSSAELHLFPAALVVGSFEREEGAPPGPVGIRFVSADQDLSALLGIEDDVARSLRGGVVSGDSRCRSVGENGFECNVPYGVFHFKVYSGGFTGKFFWDVTVNPAVPSDLGVVRFSLFSTLIGHIVTADGQPLPPNCTLLTLPQGSSPADFSANGVNFSEVTVQGLFQYQGLAEGTHTLKAACQGYAPAQVHNINIVRGRDVLLNDPVVLSPSFSIEGEILPATSPDGDRWRIVLVDHDSRRRRRFRADVDEFGSWTIDGVQQGVFDVIVESVSDVAPVKLKGGLIEAHPQAPPQLIDLDIVLIEGVVTYGGNPIRATIIFGLSSNAQFTRLFSRVESDEDGLFGGWLADAEWEEGVRWPWPVIVEGEDPTIRIQTYVGIEKPEKRGDPVRLEIKIPKTMIRGRVIDESGRPVAGASVFAEVTDGAADVNPNSALPMGVSLPADAPVLSGAGGMFEIYGLSEGKVKVHAESEEGRESESVFVQLIEDFDLPEITLRLEKMRHLEVLLTSMNQPVPGATVDVFLENSLINRVGRTDSLGWIKLRVPDKGPSSSVLFSVLPWGRCLASLSRFVPREEEPLFLEVPSEQCGTIEVFLSDDVHLNTNLLVLKGEGGFLTAFRLNSWMRSNLPGTEARTLAQTTDPSVPFVLPRVAPGSYTACLFWSRQEYLQFLQDGRFRVDRCRPSRLLSPFGTVSFDFRRE